MVTIKAGTYQFNDELTYPTQSISEKMQFVNTLTTEEGLGTPLIQFNIYAYTDGFNDSYDIIDISISYEDDYLMAISVYHSLEGGWGKDGYQTIYLTEEQEVSDEFAEWFKANAKPVVEKTEDIDYLIKSSTLTSIADSIRTKTGKTDTLSPLQMSEEILSIATTGAAIIDVYELPSENIDEQAIYRIVRPMGVYGRYDGSIEGRPEGLVGMSWQNVKDALSMIHTVPIYMLYRKTLEELNNIDTSEPAMWVCYVEDQKTIYLYEGSWEYFDYLNDIIGVDLFEPAWSIEQIRSGVRGTAYMLLDYALYTYKLGEWQVKEPKDGTKAICSNLDGELVDVSNYKYVRALIPRSIVVSSANHLPKTARNGSIAIVLGGE